MAYNLPRGGSDTWIESGPADSHPVFGTPHGLYSKERLIADDHGVRFRIGYATYGLTLFVPGSGLYWMSSFNVQLAGTSG